MGRKARKPIGPQVGPQVLAVNDDTGHVAGQQEPSREKSRATGHTDEWWKSLTDDDPVTLEPLSNLDVPPFNLASGICGGGATHYFDAVALASYITRSACFENPLTREPIGREDCVRLDEHIRRHIPRSRDFRVADALDLQRAIRVKAANASGNRSAVALRRQATAAVHGLFNFSSYSRSDALASMEGGGGWMVVDDDFQRHVEAEAIAEMHAAAAAEASRPGGPAPDRSELSFPALSSEATLASERLAELRQQGDAFVRAAARMAAESERLEQRRAADERVRRAAAKEAASQAEAARRAAKKSEFERQREEEKAAAEDAARAAERREAARQQAQEVAASRLEKIVVEESKLSTQRAELDMLQAQKRKEEEQRQREEDSAARAQREEEERIEAERQKKEREEEKKRRQKEKQRLKKEQAKAEQERMAVETAKKSATLRCAMCGDGILGKNYFELSEQKFCSTACVKKKRAAAS